MSDYGSKFADKSIEKVKKQVESVYGDARTNVCKKIREYTESFEKRDSILRSRVNEGKLSEEDYEVWRQTQVFIGERWQRKLDEVTDILLHSNEKAMSIIHGEQLNVFAENANHTAFQIDKTVGGGLSFDIYDATSVDLLTADNPELLPRKMVDGKKDKAWNKSNVAKSIAQSIILGESIDDTAKRIAKNTASRNEDGMVMYARTAMTAAQNAGRIETMGRAQEMGIKLHKKWLATLDGRTRVSHQHLDGQVKPVDEPFDSDLGEIQYPGDPDASAGNVYNCRCTLTYVFDDFADENAQRRDNTTGEVIDDMTYDEWLETKNETGTHNNSLLKKYDKLSPEEKYAMVWDDLIDKSWADFEKELNEDARRDILNLLYAGRGNRTVAEYWSMLRDGLDENDSINRILLQGDQYISPSVVKNKSDKQLKPNATTTKEPQGVYKEYSGRSWKDMRGLIPKAYYDQISVILKKNGGDDYWKKLLNGEVKNIDIEDILNYKSKPFTKEADSIIHGKKVKPSKAYEESIKKRYDNAPEWAKKVYDRFIPRGGIIGYGDWNQTNNWNGARGDIRMNFADDENARKGAGTTWFHEHGHAVDTFLGKKSTNKDFINAIRSDVDNFTKKWAFDKYGDWGARHWEAYKSSVGADISSGLRKRDRTHSIQDIFSGCDYAYSKGSSYYYKHPEKYWKDKGDYGVTTEAFAHMFEAMFDEEKTGYMRKYFPTAFSMFEGWMKEEANK